MRETDKYKKILFVSEMRNPNGNASSTQIMTKNLLSGFKVLCEHLVFIPIIENPNDAEDIKLYYQNLCNSIIFLPDVTKNRSDPLKSKLSMLASTVFSFRIKVPPDLLAMADRDTILISHSPSIDAALYCNEIKKRMPSVRYIQYWGDPLALSLITPGEYSFKRSVQRWVEKKLHKWPDRIVFGTKSLGDAQLELFPEIMDKSTSVEVCYCPTPEINSEKHIPPVFGYFGNYYSNIRNIIPFYEAAKESERIRCVICGATNIELHETDNISILQRIPQSEVTEKEGNVDVVVCLLNRVGVQIPGKVFYQTNTDKPILVITDGPNEDKIIEELRASERFVFCKNDKNSIKEAINRITQDGYIVNNEVRTYYSPEKICMDLIGDIK